MHVLALLPSGRDLQRVPQCLSLGFLIGQMEGGTMNAKTKASINVAGTALHFQRK